MALAPQKAPRRLRHHVTNGPTTTSEVLTKHFGVTRKRAAELIALGAVYDGDRRLLKNIPLLKGRHLRVYLQPRRFRVEGISWRKLVLFEDDHFIIVNKPAGLPIHATTDNIRDNVLAQFRSLLNTHLMITQRLDIPVAGLTLFAKTDAYQVFFNDLLAEKKVKKIYRALVATPPPLGKHFHWMAPGDRTPRKIALNQSTDWLPCELTVHSCKPWQNFHEVEIELHTGRTHQVRAQLAYLGSPIVGDVLYKSTEEYALNTEAAEKIALCCSLLEWTEPGGTKQSFALPPPWEK